MLKRITALFLVFVFLSAAAGCTVNNVSDTTEADFATDDVPQGSPENPVTVTDGSGARLGVINNGAYTAVDGGIFYSVFTISEGLHTGTAEYRFFSLKNKTDVFLGKLEEQGYEAGFARTELDGTVYTLAVRGDPAGSAAVPLLLLAFDTVNKTMKTYTVSEYGFPYAAMTSSCGKLYIMNHETDKEKSEKIYEFDPAGETFREVLTFSSSTDSLRSVCAADNGFYLLRLKLNNGGENELYVDLYDEKCVRISEQSVTEALVNAINEVRGITGRRDALNETGMNVSRFCLTDGRYMIYENFGLSRVAVDLKTKETIIAKDDNYSVSKGSGAPVIYRIDFDPDDVLEPEIYLIENGELKSVPFTPDAAHKLIQNVTVSRDGTRAVFTSDVFPPERGTGVISVCPSK